ncbi:MAG: hypothetical protein M3384_05525 [Acidobacteriota bacterium]|nr:hypothetical protein [Acidobacteriota bacterium]
MLDSKPVAAILIFVCLALTSANEARAQSQNFDISSGGQPTITGALNGSVSGSASPTQNLTVTINFGEVSVLNTNSLIKVVVPVAVRSSQPYQVMVSLSGTANADARALQFSDIGFGVNNMRILGNKAQICTNGSHVFRTPFGGDPSTGAAVNSAGRVAYRSSLASVSSGSTVILSGPKLTQGTGSSRRDDDGWVFDVILVITPQFFSAGSTGATLTFSISPGPNVQC